VHELIAGRTVLDHVIDTCKKASGYLNAKTWHNNIRVSVALLVPAGDVLAELYSNARVDVMEGDENDVLSRYKNMLDKFQSDYIVRITSDCPRIPQDVISRHILFAVKEKLDYTNNVHEGLRTSPDGYDCEVLSNKAITWLSENAVKPYDREHVTTLLRSERPDWLSDGLVVSRNDFHKIKLSVDTHEDLQLVIADEESVRTKTREAKKIYTKVFTY
jgi:spore coat polysaccharide biosynthesis protein SpsF